MGGRLGGCLGGARVFVWRLFRAGWVGGGAGGGVQSPSLTLLHPPEGAASRNATVAVSRSNTNYLAV